MLLYRFLQKAGVTADLDPPRIWNLYKRGAQQKQTTALHQGWKLAFRYILIINERLNQNSKELTK